MIIFENIGELDANAIRMMGVSVKNENAIGFFGTGLKYALAILLRGGQKVTVYSGIMELTFATETLEIRGQSFDAITMNGERLGFTTDLGKTWLMWMAFRELYSNAKDEGGIAFDGEPNPRTGYTTIAVGGDLFRAEFFKKQENFIEGTPLFSDGIVEIYDRPNAFLFYRGVRVGDARSPSLYTYNILSRLDLTEDRTILYSWEPYPLISNAIMQMKDRRALYRILTVKDTLEHTMLSYESHRHSEEFEAVALREYKTDAFRVNDGIRKFVRKLNKPGLYEACELSIVQRKQLDRAVQFCNRIGYPSAEYEVLVTETLGPVIMAEALRAERTILLSKQCFEKGTKFLASTLIEEVVHLREGLNDESRNLQTYLFDKIISLGEELQGEPL